MKRSLALIAALCCAQAFAYVGTFDPAPQRHVATITFIDSQAAGATCAIEAAKISPVYALLSPLMVQLTACYISDPPTIIAPITLGPGSLYALATTFGFPDAQLGHEGRHAFDDGFHPALLPFVDLVRNPRCEARRSVAREQPTEDVRPTPERSAQQLRVPTKDETVCVIFVNECDVSYSDFGALVRECIK